MVFRLNFGKIYIFHMLAQDLEGKSKAVISSVIHSEYITSMAWVIGSSNPEIINFE
jgi:hypothetical protein